MYLEEERTQAVIWATTTPKMQTTQFDFCNHKTLEGIATFLKFYYRI